jgi:pyridinium-3,5-biscarboxylic acid mononucleotide synthase
VGVGDALARLSRRRWRTCRFARLDHHRALRHGFPEVAFGEGKTPDQLVEIGQRIAARATPSWPRACARRAAGAGSAALPAVQVDAVARTAFLPAPEPVERRVRGTVLVVTAGTSDLPVAEEAAVCAAALGNPVETLDRRRRGRHPPRARRAGHARGAPRW